MNYSPAKFEVAMSKGLGRNAFTKIFDMTRLEKHCPLHHVTYVPAKFEVAPANGLGDAFTRKYIL